MFVLVDTQLLRIAVRYKVTAASRPSHVAAAVNPPWHIPPSSPTAPTPFVYSRMDDRTKEAVTTWKTHRYKPNHLPFTEAVYSLLTASPLIRLKRSAVRPNEWVVSVSSYILRV